MSRVFTSVTGADVVLFSHDHRPPHVHVRHRQEGWVARFRFSFIDPRVRLHSLASPSPIRPTARDIDGIIAEIAERLADCRERWWAMQRNIGLNGHWVQFAANGGIEVKRRKPMRGSQIVSGSYDTLTRRVRVELSDGQMVECVAGGGVDEHQDG